MPTEYEEFLRQEAIAQLRQVWDEKETTVAELNRVKAELEALKRLVFGRKSERFVPEESPVNQLVLGFNGEVIVESQESKQIEEITYTREKPKKAIPHGRSVLPEHLPRIDTVIEPEEDVTGMKK